MRSTGPALNGGAQTIIVAAAAAVAVAAAAAAVAIIAHISIEKRTTRIPISSGELNERRRSPTAGEPSGAIRLTEPGKSLAMKKKSTRRRGRFRALKQRDVRKSN